jgi:hypothetical protein
MGMKMRCCARGGERPEVGERLVRTSPLGKLTRVCPAEDECRHSVPHGAEMST